MGIAYRTADHYSDDARMVVRYTQGGTTTEATHPFRVAFSRPDRLRVEAYDARVVTDGQSLFAATGAVPGQVLVEPVRTPLDMEQIFADDVVRGTMTEGEAGCPPQLPLLLADDTLHVILADAISAPRIVGRDTVDGHACHRMRVEKPDGGLEMWIDRESAILRRMRLPTKAYADEASRRAGAPVAVSVEVEFSAAAFARPPDQAFAFEVPDNASRVSRLQPLDRPLPPHPALGRQAGLPPLATADGSTLDALNTASGPVVLEFFFDSCAPATRTMPEVAAGITAYAARESSRTPAPLRVRHFAVSLDPKDFSITEIRRRLAEFGGVGTLLRDPQGAAARALGLESFPATVILASDGSVADVIVGDRLHIAADVTETIALVARGQSTVAMVKSRHRRRLDEYRRALDRAANGGDRRLSEQVVGPQRQPDRFKLRPGWRAAVALPGNLVCLDAANGADAPRIVVLDGWRTVVQFDADGRQRGRYDLDLPADAAVNFLRSAITTDGGRRWLGGRRGDRRVFVFDDAFGLLTTYPAAVDAGEPIAGAELADLDEDGVLELIVGFLGERGIEVATVDGQLLWADRKAAPVASVAVGPPVPGRHRSVLFVTGDGRLGRTSPSQEPPIESPKPDKRLASISAGPVAAEGTWAVIGITPPDLDAASLIGIDSLSLESRWELPLTAAASRGAIEPAAWADLLGTKRRQWLVAAADGSVTVAWADGRIVDRYFHGRPLLGMGGYRHGERGCIALATRAGVEVLFVEDIALD